MRNDACAGTLEPKHLGRHTVAVVNSFTVSENTGLLNWHSGRRNEAILGDNSLLGSGRQLAEEPHLYLWVSLSKRHYFAGIHKGRGSDAMEHITDQQLFRLSSSQTSPRCRYWLNALAEILNYVILLHRSMA